jgi:Flp pilus assembly protein TadG
MKGARSMIEFLKRRLRRTPLRDDRGSVMLEFAFAMPLLLTILLGGIELGRYVLLHQKLDRTAMTISDLVSRVTQVTTSELDTIFLATDLVMAPFAMGDRGAVVVSSVKDDSGTPTVVWQRAGAGTLTVTSEIGVQGGTATISDEEMLSTGEGIVVGESYFDYTPWLMQFIPSIRLRHVAIFRPRLNNEVACPDC